MESLLKKLERIGLSGKEADAYAAVLRLGEATVSDIAREAGIKRTTAYEYIDALLEGGLVSQTVRKKRTLYIPEHPKKLLHNLDREEAVIREKRRVAGECLPELESLYALASSHPTVAFYEGREGLLDVYRQIVETHKDVYSFFTPEKFYGVFTLEQNDALLTRLYENGGRLYNLVERSEAARAHLKLKQYDNFVKSKVLPEGFRFETDLIIYGDTIALISFRTLIGVLIRDQSIADLQKSIFKMIWKTV